MTKQKLKTAARLPSRSLRVLKAGAIELVPERFGASVAGKTVKLSPKEFTVLKLLLEAKGDIVSRDFLLEKMWGTAPGSQVESRTVNVHVHRLRQKLGPHGHRILTVKNVGYRFDISFDWIKFGT